MNINTNLYNSYLSTRYQNTLASLGLGNTSSAKSASGSLDSLFTSLPTLKGNPIDYASLSYVKNLKSGAGDLQKSAANLKSSTAPTRTAPVSSDTEAMTVAQTGGKYSNNYASAVAGSVTIEQLAAGQKNTGDALKSNETVDPEAAGYKLLEIEAGGKRHQISFEVKAGDTNIDVQKKMVDAINGAKTGVTASLETKDGASALKLESSATGNESAFEIKDISGGAVSMTGADKVTQRAQDAVYYLNGSGTANTSASNTVNIGGGVSATFKKAGGGDVQVSKGFDTGGAVNALKGFAESYNNLYNTALESGDKKGEKLAGQLVTNSQIYTSTLSSLGIGFNSKGEMTIDEEKAKSAAESGELSAFFNDGSGKNYGFTNNISRIASDAASNTGKYVSSSSVLSDLTYNPNQSKSLAQYDSLGMFLNLLF